MNEGENPIAIPAAEITIPAITSQVPSAPMRIRFA